MKKGFWQKILVGLSAVAVAILAPASAYAKLPESDLYFYGQNGIYFYDTSSETCPITPTDVYKGEQFNLTDEEIRGFARAAQNENSCNLNAIKSELSLMANLYERHKSQYSSVVDYLTRSGWFAASTVAAFNNSGMSVSDEYVQAAKDVLVNGNRTLPAQVVEHDCVGDLDWVEVDGVKHYGTNAGGCRGTGLSDKSLYKSGKTIIHNVYGSTYVFYQWAGGSESSCGDPFGYFEGSEVQESYSTVAGNNVNYAGAQVWSDAEMQTIQANQAIYEEAANKFNFPWQILAVLHSHETGLRRYNPANGQGVYQLYSYTAGGTNKNRFEPAESISEEEFRRQTLIAAEVVSGMVGDLNDPGNIKRLFFQYNGVASVYIEKAINMGFSEEEARNGEGSAYVMNRYDARRDPTSSSMSSLWPGRYVADGVYDSSSVSYGFGAFVQYEALAGLSSQCSTSGGGNIAETAILLSWDGFGHSMYDPKPEYVTAMKEVGAYIKPSGTIPEGASCDQFVGTVMRYSGADPEFPVFWPPSQVAHMESHPEMYQKIEANGDFSKLLPGDIFVTIHNGNHIFLYIGEIDGVPAQASASYGGRTGEHFKGVSFTDGYGSDGGTRVYSVYRRINY